MNSTMPLVSIVVPVYNGARYLGRCLDSLTLQTGCPVEVLVVDDGSSDSTLEIARRYERSVPFVRAITQENAGVSVARNNGIEAATGRYLLFVDADDWIEPDTAASMAKMAEDSGAQVVHFSYQYEYVGRKLRAEPLFPDGTLLQGDELRRQVFPLFLTMSKLNACWSNLYSVEFLRKKELRFLKGCILAEDYRFVMAVFEAADKALFSDKICYHYFSNPKNAISNFTEKHMRDSLSTDRLLDDFLKRWDMETPENLREKRRMVGITALMNLEALADSRGLGTRSRELMFEILEDESNWLIYTQDKELPKDAVYRAIVKDICAKNLQHVYRVVRLECRFKRWRHKAKNAVFVAKNGMQSVFGGR